MLDIKTKVYNALSDLSISLSDNPDYYKDHNKCPFAILRTINESPQYYKNFQKANWLIRIDVFSKYKGEKEIKDYYENEVLPAVKGLLEEDGITYITPSIGIMDESELGPIQKHGVISLVIDTMEVNE